LNDASNEEHLQAGREEGDADGGSHEHHASDHCLFVSDPFGNVTVDDETNDASNLLDHVS
jgi:hypothetical protein